ncbi:hypothetical protein [Embleya sp. NPDC020886]|uniref:hypothetical protein n=1 Tax=Embleya sp. NPDC020886 TaxID=3363980 RepID=UPI0037894793
MEWITLLAGFVGTIVGAGASFAGTWWTQRQADTAAREQHARMQTHAAIETTVNAVLALRHHGRAFPTINNSGGSGNTEEHAWAERLPALLDGIDLATMQIRDRELRERLTEIIGFSARYEYFVSLTPNIFTPGTFHRSSTVGPLAEHAIACLGARLRDEPLPEPSATLLSVRATEQELMSEGHL